MDIISEDKLSTTYHPLSTLLTWRWENNPKLHATELIEYSILQHGFNDNVGVDAAHKIVVEGHGRLELLEKLRQSWMRGENGVPRNIQADGEEWYVPCTGLDFTDRAAALRYALLHNRSNASHLDRRDYAPDRLKKALGDAYAEQAQMPLMGFTQDELNAMDGDELPTYTAPPLAAMPELPAWDRDAPGSMDTRGLGGDIASKTDEGKAYMLMVTFPTFELLQEGLHVLSFGERSSLPALARLATLEGVQLLERWKAGGMTYVPKPEVRPEASAPLPGQIGIDGKVVGSDIVIPAGHPDPFKALGDALTEGGLVAWDSPEAVVKAQPTAPAPKPSKASSKWVGGLCMKCGGSGYLWSGRDKSICPDCNGAGDEATYLKQQQPGLI